MIETLGFTVCYAHKNEVYSQSDIHSGRVNSCSIDYRKPPTISPGLIYFRKRFLMALYKGGLIYGWAYTWTIFCVSNKQVRHKQVSHKIINVY